MKKIIYLSLFLFVFKAEAQESVTFNMKYLPGHDYNGTVSMDIKCNITLSGDDQIIDKLNAQGMTQPIAFNMGMKMNGDTKTEAHWRQNNIFPLMMNYKIDELKHVC